jgi:UDP-3-O-[3-hydroxymyristoyl] glucosamine N-acyltransferase
MKLSEIAKRIGGELVGADVEITGVGAIETAVAGDLVRVDAPKNLEAAEKSPAAAFLVGKDVAPTRPAIRVSNARLAFSKALELFARPETTFSGVHPSAVVGRDVRIGAGCVVGPHAVLEDGVVLEERVTIHPNTVVGAGTQIGAESVLFSNVTVYPRVRIGRRVRIHSGTVIGADGYAYEWDGAKHAKIPAIGTVQIHDDVEIGANCCVDRATTGATVVGPGTKIDNFVQVAHNVQVGAHCLLICMVGIAGSAKIGNGVVMMGGACAREHVSIGDRSRIGLRAECWSDVPAGVDYSGKPARPHREELRRLAALARLPDLLRKLKAD